MRVVDGSASAAVSVPLGAAVGLETGDVDGALHLVDPEGFGGPYLVSGDYDASTVMDVPVDDALGSGDEGAALADVLELEVAESARAVDMELMQRMTGLFAVGVVSRVS